MFSATPQNGLGGAPLIVGVDEAGRGPLAGPVVAAAVVLCKPAPQGMMQAEALPAGAGAVLVELASSSGHAHWNGDTLLRAALDL